MDQQKRKVWISESIELDYLPRAKRDLVKLIQTISNIFDYSESEFNEDAEMKIIKCGDAADRLGEVTIEN